MEVNLWGRKEGIHTDGKEKGLSSFIPYVRMRYTGGIGRSTIPFFEARSPGRDEQNQAHSLDHSGKSLVRQLLWHLSKGGWHPSGYVSTGSSRQQALYQAFPYAERAAHLRLESCLGRSPRSV